MMSVGIYIYKQTDNLAESEPRMTSDWKGFQGGQLFEVPLHDNDQQYRTIPTGLVRVQEDRMSQGFVNWIKPSADPAFPPISYPENASYVAINGCPLSFSDTAPTTLEKLANTFCTQKRQHFRTNATTSTSRWSAAAVPKLLHPKIATLR